MNRKTLSEDDVVLSTASEDDVVLSTATFEMDIYKHLIIFVGNVPLCY